MRGKVATRIAKDAALTLATVRCNDVYQVLSAVEREKVCIFN